MSYIYLFFNTLRNNKVKYFITILSVTISIGSVLLITAISTTSEHVIRKELSRSGVDSIMVQLEDGYLDYEDVKLIRENVQEVQIVSPVYFTMAESRLVHEKDDIFLWGIDEYSSNLVSIDVIHGRNITKQDTERNAKVCLIDKEIALKEYKRENVVGKTIQVKVNNRWENFEIVGVMNAEDNLLKSMLSGHLKDFVYIPYTTLEEMGSKSFDKIGVSLKSGTDENYVKAKIKNTLKSSKGSQIEITVENLAVQKSTLDGIFNIITGVLTIIASISMLISGLMIMSLMIAAVGERTAEIGIKKALGATRGVIMREFLFEAIFFCVSGFIISFLFIVVVIRSVLLLFGIPLLFHWPTVLFIFTFSVIMGGVFGVYPAFKAANLNPVDAFRK